MGGRRNTLGQQDKMEMCLQHTSNICLADQDIALGTSRKRKKRNHSRQLYASLTSANTLLIHLLQWTMMIIISSSNSNNHDDLYEGKKHDTI